MGTNGQQPGAPDPVRELQQVRQAVFTRSRIHFGEFVDALLYTCLAAEQGDAGAKAELGQLLQALERCKVAAAGIASAQGVQILPPRG